MNIQEVFSSLKSQKQRRNCRFILGDQKTIAILKCTFGVIGHLKITIVENAIAATNSEFYLTEVYFGTCYSSNCYD